MSKNPIQIAIASKDKVQAAEGDLVIFKAPADVLEERDYNNLQGKICRVEATNTEETRVRSLFFGDDYYVSQKDVQYLKRINWKKPRGDREVKIGETILTKDGLTTTVIDVLSDGIITYMWNEKGINCLYYKLDFFRMAFVKGKWRFRDQEEYDFNIDWIIPYLPSRCYISGREDLLLSHAKDLKLTDKVLIQSESSSEGWIVTHDLGDTWILVEEDSARELADSYAKLRTVFVNKTNDTRWFYVKKDGDGSCYFPKELSEKSIKESLGLK